MPAPKRHPYDQWSPDARALDLVGDKWTLLIVRDLSAGPRRFVELLRMLPGISTEQLRSRLNRMVAEGMLTRMRYREVPPRVEYELTERSRRLMPVLRELARWGYDWAWSQPRRSESVDPGAIFRLGPGLVFLPGVNATIEFAVAEGQKRTSYTFTLSDGRLAVEERPADRPQAVVVGNEGAWIRAFSPGHDRGDLEIRGDRQLALKLLEDLAANSPRNVAGPFRAAA